MSTNDKPLTGPPIARCDTKSGVRRHIVWFRSVDMERGITRHVAVERRGEDHVVLVGLAVQGFLEQWLELDASQDPSLEHNVKAAQFVADQAEGVARNRRDFLSSASRPQPPHGVRNHEQSTTASSRPQRSSDVASTARATPHPTDGSSHAAHRHECCAVGGCGHRSNSVGLVRLPQWGGKAGV